MKNFKECMFQLENDWTGHAAFYKIILSLVVNMIVDNLQEDEYSLKKLIHWIKASHNTIALSEIEVSGRMAYTMLHEGEEQQYVIAKIKEGSHAKTEDYAASRNSA